VAGYTLQPKNEHPGHASLISRDSRVAVSLEEDPPRERRESEPAGGAISDDENLGPDTQAMPIDRPKGAGWILAGRYRVIDRIGAGGMAEVFRAHDLALGRDVAVKVFRSHADAADGAGGIERQQLELRALARLNHPNLIALFDGSLADTQDPAFLVMELINGPSLAARLADAPLPEAEARTVAIQIADALAYVHGEGMVHRDVKPANILLGTDGASGEGAVRARLSDFGIVRLMGSERLTGVELLVGTATYLAPEQARGADVGPEADVYALGLVMIEALTCVRSFEGSGLEAVIARLERSPEIPEDLPHPWPALLRSMTAADPAARPAAAQVAETLRNVDFPPTFLPLTPAFDAEMPTAMLPAVADEFSLLSSMTGPGSPDGVEEAFGAPRRRGRLLAVALLAAIVAVVGFLLTRLPSEPSTPSNLPTSSPSTATHPISPATRGSRSGPLSSAVSTTGPSTQAARSPARSTSAASTRATAPIRSTSPNNTSAAFSSVAPSSSAVPTTAPTVTTSSTAGAASTRAVATSSVTSTPTPLATSTSSPNISP
jgi:serine/threonine protein kinase